ncbi:MAG: S8 family serine peptidase [Roseiflexaceae bacterium]|nr:S8 family serine peptidase [Roseiflexaceae bacterium]
MRRTILSTTLLLCVAFSAPLAQAAPSAQPVPPIEPLISTEAPLHLPPGVDDPATLVTAMVQLAEPTFGTAVRGVQQLAQAQQQLIPQLEQRGAQVVFQTQLVYNGMAVVVPAGDLDALRSIQGVAAVQVITPKSQSEANISALISSSLTQAAPEGASGAGVTVGVIDSGIDYTHADFGGLGTTPAYVENNPLLVEPGSFPTRKVTGGYDFAGDNYSAIGDATAIVPMPDADPLDCTGRGTHIAGVIAGVGVGANGKPFTGPYQPSGRYAALRIPPGVAPAASLYALKVFGCAGTTTTLTTQALEWAVDPNRDGDPADHLDIVIIALSTPFGSSDDPDAVAVQRATELGVTVVAAAGDGGGGFYSVNAFASASSAIAVGASIGSPAPLSAPADAYTDPACFDRGDLVGRIVSDGEGEITNRSDDCTYTVGFAAYRKFDELIDHQHIFDATTAEIAPGRTIRLAIALPNCATQIDLFRGPVLYSLQGRRYNTRLISARHIGGTNYCAPETALTYGLPDTTARGLQRGNGELKPDLVAPSININSAGAGSGNGSSQFSASWTGAAQVAGAAALLKAQHPSWAPAQIKAALMNSAAPVLMDDETVYPPSLAGAGQLDLSRLTNIGLLVQGETGSASLSYGAPAISQPWTASRSLRLQNESSAPLNVTLSETAAAREPGITLEYPKSPIEVPANSTVEVSVSMAIDPALLDFSPDLATKLDAPNLGAPRPRFYLAEHSGYLQLRSAGAKPTSVPFVVLPRSASSATAAGEVGMAADSRSWALPLRNTGARNAGSIDRAGNPQLALVSAFELLESSPAQESLSSSLRAADLRYVGITSNFNPVDGAVPALLYVGLATYAPWSTPNEVQFRLLIDTDLDQRGDFILLNYGWPDAQGRVSDRFRWGMYRLNSDGSLGDFMFDSFWNTLPPYQASPYLDIAPFNTSVMFGLVSTQMLGLPAGQTTINLQLESRARDAAGFTTVVDRLPERGWRNYDMAQPAIAPLAQSGNFASRPVFVDATDSLVSGVARPDLIAARGTQLLLLHHHNLPSKQAELVNIGVSGLELLSVKPSPHRVYIPFSQAR